MALTAASKIFLLARLGVERTKLSGPAHNRGGTVDPLPWANPANIAFNDDDGALIVTNRASLVADPTGLFAIFDVFVNDKAGKLYPGGED